MNSEICLVVTVGFLFRDITSDLIMSLRPVLTRWMCLYHHTVDSITIDDDAIRTDSDAVCGDCFGRR